MALTHTPVVVVASGGIAVTQVDGTPDGTPMTVVDVGKDGLAITLVDDGGIPARLFDEDGVEYVPA